MRHLLKLKTPLLALVLSIASELMLFLMAALASLANRSDDTILVDRFWRWFHQFPIWLTELMMRFRDVGSIPAEITLISLTALFAVVQWCLIFFVIINLFRRDYSKSEIKPLRKVVTTALGLLVAVSVLIFFSAFHAYKISNDYVGGGIPLPFFSIQFAFHPNLYIDGAPELGLRPGWVVTYAPSPKNYGTACFVSLFGSVLASGTPDIVTKEQQQSQDDLKKFRQAFAEVDASIQVGMAFSNAVAILRIPPFISTNGDGTTDAHYTFMPRDLEYARNISLTNGIILRVSKGVVIRKTYAYMLSP
jgi:hypothetical protein